MKIGKHMTKYIDIEKKLLDKRDELRARVSSVEKDFNKGRSADSEEQATEAENEEVLIELQREAQQELVIIDEALMKLEQGSYGICSQCGEEISQGRLDALPYVINCINCAN